MENGVALAKCWPVKPIITHHMGKMMGMEGNPCFFLAKRFELDVPEVKVH